MKVTIDIPDDLIGGLLVVAFESGHYGSFLIDGYDNNELTVPGDKQIYEWLPLQEGAAVLCFDRYEYAQADARDEAGVPQLRLDRAAIDRGLVILAAKYPHHFADFLKQDADVITADAFVQCALLGDMVYA